MDRYDKVTDQKTKRIIKNEMELIRYYIGTIINKYNNQVTNTKSLKLEKYFIRKANWTID